jgi:hypothetical protein
MHLKASLLFFKCILFIPPLFPLLQFFSLTAWILTYSFVAAHQPSELTLIYTAAVLSHWHIRKWRLVDPDHHRIFQPYLLPVSNSPNKASGPMNFKTTGYEAVSLLGPFLRTKDTYRAKIPAAWNCVRSVSHNSGTRVYLNTGFK